MKNNKLMWGITTLIVLLTIALSFGTIDSYSQKETPKQEEQISFEQLVKHIPVVDYDTPDQMNTLEREQRTIKNKRYDHILDVVRKPSPEYDMEISSGAEPIPPLIPFAESKLIVSVK